MRGARSAPLKKLTTDLKHYPVQASELTLSEVEDQFNWRQVIQPQFCQEWQIDLSVLSQMKWQALDRFKAEFLYPNKYPMFEELVKMVVTPLLSLAGFYRPLIRPVIEKNSETSGRASRELEHSLGCSAICLTQISETISETTKRLSKP